MKYLLVAIMALGFAGCVKHEAQIDCVQCNAHLENGSTTVDCDTCTFNYDGSSKEGNIVNVNLPELPSRP